MLKYITFLFVLINSYCTSNNNHINPDRAQIRISLMDNSLNSENTSIKLMIDAIEILNIDTINYKLDYYYYLSPGHHREYKLDCVN